MENASFVIDLDALPHPEDVGVNDLGKWIHIGSPKSYIAVERNKSGHILDVQGTRQKRTDFHDKEAHIGSGYLSCTIISQEGTDWHCISISLKVEKPF